MDEKTAPPNDLADRVATVRSYRQEDFDGTRKLRQGVEEVILINAKWRDTLVAALRAYAGGPAMTRRIAECARDGHVLRRDGSCAHCLQTNLGPRPHVKRYRITD